MHGVSHPWVERAFRLFGFAPFIAVREQQEPDPEFPTVKFPNPEEKGSRHCGQFSIEFDMCLCYRRVCELHFGRSAPNGNV
jgi:phosphomannomutase